MMIKEKIKSLISDWIGLRDQKTFIHRNAALETGWDASVKKSYTEFITKGLVPADLDILKWAYRLCNQRLRIMAPGKNVKVSFHPTDSFTDGSKLFVATEVVDVNEYSTLQKLDVMLGLTVHETLHILLTDFSRKFSHNKFQHSILNIVEDERIEHECGNLFPGYAAWLEKTKEFYFDFKHSKKEFKSDYEKVFDCFFRLIRFPKHLDISLTEDHVDFLLEVKSVLTPYPSTFKGAYISSVKIADLFRNKFRDMIKDEEEKNGNGSGLSGSEIDGAIEKILKSLSEKVEDLNSDNSHSSSSSEADRSEKVASVLTEDPINFDIIEDNGNVSQASRTIFRNGENNIEEYSVIRKSSISGARSLANVLTLDISQKPMILKGMRSGVIDESKLAELIQGVENVNTVALQSPKKNISVVLMIDESGSMGGTKIQDAAKVAVTFSEALKRIPSAKLFIYGFTSDIDGYGTNRITIYQEPGFKSKFALGSVAAKGSNRDGVCIREVAARVRKFTSTPSLFFVISDGQPSAYDYNDGIADTAKAVREISKKNFVPVQIGINVNASVQSEMFSDHVNYSDSRDMVNGIKRVLRKKIRQLTP